MNKTKRIIIAFLGGMDVFMIVTTPMFIYFFWIYLFGIKNWVGLVLFVVTFCSSIFRAIKIGWIKR